MVDNGWLSSSVEAMTDEIHAVRVAADERWRSEDNPRLSIDAGMSLGNPDGAL
jgi:hypothetical protein